jgi:hypothetical protein
MKQITIKINEDGSKVEIDAEGFVGSGCKDITGSLQRALGIVADSKIKSEYYETVNDEVVLNV